LYQLEAALSLKHGNSFKPSCFDCFICSKYCTGIFSPESSGSFYIRSFSHIYIASFAPASSVVQSRQLMLPLSAALASREVLQGQLGIKASARTIRRELRRAGYRRCISCLRPFITRAQAKKRLAFAYEHRWWGTTDYAAHRNNGKQGGDWRTVIWSDEASFETGKRGRMWVTRRIDERRCQSYIRSIYRSGRMSVMI
jgi:Transposase